MAHILKSVLRFISNDPVSQKVHEDTYTVMKKIILKKTLVLTFSACFGFCFSIWSYVLTVWQDIWHQAFLHWKWYKHESLSCTAIYTAPAMNDTA